MVRRRQRQYPQLSREQQRLVAEHVWISGRLAHAAKSLTGGHTGSLTREDLESIANFALCVAATKYDPSKEVKYSTYAWKTASGYIRHALRDYSRLVKTPRWVAKYKEQVLAMLKDNMTYEEIAKELQIDESRVLDCQLSENNYHVSYDMHPEDWGATEFVYEVDEVKSTLLSGDLVTCIDGLTDCQMELLSKFVDGGNISGKEKDWASKTFDHLKAIAHGLG